MRQIHFAGALRRSVLALGVCGGLALSLPATGAFADASNQNTLTSQAIQQQGTASGPGATAGPALAIAQPIVVQQNHQICGCSPEDAALVTQNALNSVSGQQTAGAVSGNASSSGGTALSGASMANALVVVIQINLQVVMGDVPDGGITQNAANAVNINQTTVSYTGGASAGGAGSQATSGNAGSVGAIIVRQQNMQIWIAPRTCSYCEQEASQGSSLQESTNNGTIEQGLLSTTGAATAGDAAQAISGDTNAAAQHTLTQITNQTSN